MNSSFYTDLYAAHLRSLQQHHSEARTMELLVGDSDHWVGLLEYGALLNLGLKTDDLIVDVGCGTGRLSSRLALSGHAGGYVGTDLLTPVVEYARKRAARPDWQFSVASAPPIPVGTGGANWVTFFSVFTHILDEDIYLYLRDAKRMLKPGGKIVFSYLDLGIADHWAFFEKSLAENPQSTVLNRYLNEATIRLWSEKLGLRVENIMAGPDPWIRLSPPLVEHELNAPFWQSIAVLSNPTPGRP